MLVQYVCACLRACMWFSVCCVVCVCIACAFVDFALTFFIVPAVVDLYLHQLKKLVYGKNWKELGSVSIFIVHLTDHLEKKNIASLPKKNYFVYV